MDTKTALTVVIPSEFHQQINKIRLQYDKAYPRWMPHINLIFPFVDTFDSSLIEEQLKQLNESQTLIKMNDIGFFSSRGVNTYHLKFSDSDTESHNNLMNVFNIVSKSHQNLKIRDFSPHMTLGQSKTSDQIKMMKELKDWLNINGPIVFNIRHISHLKRTDTGNFYEFKKFPLANYPLSIVEPEVKQEINQNMDSNVDTYLCIDNSGSTSGHKLYWNNVDKILNEKHKIIFWGSDAKEITHSAAKSLIEKKSGSSGGTYPHTFISMIPPKSNLIIITDGSVAQQDVNKCDDILQGREFASVSVYFFFTGGKINMSVSAPFVRNTEKYMIFVEGELKGSGSSNKPIDLLQYYNEPEKLLNDAENLYQLIVIQNMGKTNETLRKELIDLLQNLLKFISNKKSNDTEIDEVRKILNERETKAEENLEQAVNKMKSLVKNLGESIGESVERIIQKLISKCVDTTDYSFENLSSGRIVRSKEVLSIKPDEIQEESYSADFECPISLDNDFPLLLIKQGEPVLVGLEKQELDNYLNNPLFVLYNIELVEKIKSRIDHLFGLTSVKKLFESRNIRSPFTMAPISSALSFGIDPSHIKSTNFAMADLFFGKKLVGQKELWLILLYNIIIKIPYINNNTDFIKKYQEHIIHRVKNVRTNITLSGIGSLHPLIKVSMDLGIWYCVMSPWILEDEENDCANRLRYFGETAIYLMDILDMLHYPYDKKALTLIKIYRVFSWFMKEEKNGSNWRSVLKAQYQNSITLTNNKSENKSETKSKSDYQSTGIVILLDGPPVLENIPRLPKFINEFLSESSVHSLTFGHLLTLEKMVDGSKTTMDIKIGLNLAPTEVKAVTNFDQTNKLKNRPMINISKETLRPEYIDKQNGKYWFECAQEIYGKKFISLDNYFIRYVTEKLKYPSANDFICYISSKEANKEHEPSETLPMFIQKSVDGLFDRYEKVLGKKFSECSVEQFIKITQISRNKDVREQMDGSFKFKK